MESLARTLATQARSATGALARASSAQKNEALLAAAEMLQSRQRSIATANRKDLAAGRENGLSGAMLDRLEITKARLESMAEGLAQVAALPDPVGATLDGWRRPNGLYIRKVRVPIGVIFMIFESRPNVTIDAGSLCLKSGNAAILRGGKEALHSNRVLGAVLADAVVAAGLPKHSIQVVQTPDRALATALLHEDRHLDLVIPRGGKGLIETVMRESVIPVLAHLDGICHVYVDEHADLAMAEAIAVNAKTQRTGVCNAMETLLVHKAVAKDFLPGCLRKLRRRKVELRVDGRTRRHCRGVKVTKADEADWRTEYLDLVLAVKVVDDLDAAVWHINEYGSHHTDAIVTADVAAAERFRQEVDSSSVMVNASTRFSDGFEYGLGAEIGISTNRLHARGPVGLEELTTYKFLVDGNGQIRE
jgi:glutamate-5-semialdehyde dehydrogenase